MVIKVKKVEQTNLFTGRYPMIEIKLKNDASKYMYSADLEVAVNEIRMIYLNDQIENEGQYRYTINVAVKTPIQWIAIGEKEIDTYYVISDIRGIDDSMDQTRSDIKWNRFLGANIYISQYEMRGGKQEHFNNCLFLGIKSFFKKCDLELPKKLNKAYKLKDALDIPHNKPIHINRISEVEDMYKINICVSGDVEKFRNKYKRTLSLRFKDGHFDNYEWNPTFEKAVVRCHEYNPVFYMINKDKMTLYYPSVEKTKDVKINYNLSGDRKNGEYYIEYSGKKDAEKFVEFSKKTYDDWIQLKEITNGDINPFFYCNNRHIALNLFKKFNVDLKCDPMDRREEIWINNTRVCGLMKCKEKGKKLSYAIKYDVNSKYPFTMKSSTLILPTSNPVFRKLDKLPEKLVNGVYRCIITNNKDKDNDMLFEFNEKNHYTIYDIQSAKKLKFDIELIQDDDDNCMLYTGNKTSGAKVFGEYVNYLYELKIKYPENKQLKILLNILWGSLFMKWSRKYIHDTNIKTMVDKNEKVKSVCPTNDNNNKLIVEFEPIANYYRYNEYARMIPFIVSHSRKYMTNVLCEHISHIWKIHTDGFISDKKIQYFDDKLNSDMGDYKIENEGECLIHNVICADWN